MAGKNEWHVVGRGFAGWHAAGVNVSSSGGNLDPYTYWTGEKCKGYRQEAVEGALVYDAEHLESDRKSASAFIKLILSGPMVSPDLPPDGVDRFSNADRKSALRMLPGLSGGYDTLAILAQDETFTGLDKVGVKVFEGLLRQVPGIKIGHIQNGEVTWE